MIDRRTLLLSGTFLVATGAGPVAVAEDKPSIKIGALLPISGFGASYGTLFQTALNLAVDDVNTSGGVNGSRIELLAEDDQFQATQSVLLFRRLAGRDVSCVVGPISGTGWENVAPIANALRVPALNYSALKPDISKRPYALRIHPADDTMIPEAVGEFVKALPNVKSVVIVGDTQEASAAAGIQLLGEAAKKYGIQVLDTLTYQSRTTDFSPLVIKIRSLDPQAVFISSHVPTALPFLKEMEAQGVKRTSLATALVWGGTNFVVAVGSAGDHLYSMGFNTNEAVPGDDLRNSFFDRFLKATLSTNLQQPANVSNTTVAYDSILLIADVLRRAGVDGNTGVSVLRDTLTQGLNKLTDWKGINQFHMRPSGDGHIQGHLIKADVANKRWVYALSPQDRITKPAL